MHLSPNSILFIGFLFTGVLWIAGFSKKLRNDKVIKVVTLIATIIAIVGLVIRSPQTEMVRGNATDSFFMPLIYIVSYALLRFIYKKYYKVEPTYERFSWYDPEDKRRQNWLDVTVYVLPVILSIFIPLLIS